MKKQLLIGAMLMGAFFTANAQFTQSFEGSTDLPDGWTVINEGDEGTWGVVDLTGSDLTAEDGTNIISILYNETEAHDDYLVTPAITVVADETDRFSFYARSRDPLYPETATLLVSTTTATAAAFTETLEDIEPASGPDFVLYEIDLSEYVGETIYLAFHSTTENMFAFDIDSVVLDSDGTAGINDILASRFSVFPNPATDVINITNAENILVSGVSIADINGRTVKSAQFSGVNNTSVNVSDLASGVYMMTVSSDKGTMTKKIVKN